MKVTDKTSAGMSGVTGTSVKKTGFGKDLKNNTTSPLADLGSSANVDLSERAQDLKRAKEVAMAGVHDVDEEKVAKFQRLIDSGQYKTNARAIAEKMLEEHVGTLRAESDKE